MYDTLLLFLHIMFLTLFVGSGAAMSILWHRARLVEGGTRENLLGGVYLLSKKMVVKTGSGTVLVGILMITSQPAIMSGALLFKAKITLGVILLGLTAAIHSRLRRLEGNAGASPETILADGTLDTLLKMITVLGPIVILLGILHGHS